MKDQIALVLIAHLIGSGECGVCLFTCRLPNAEAQSQMVSPQQKHMSFLCKKTAPKRMGGERS